MVHMTTPSTARKPRRDNTEKRTGTAEYAGMIRRCLRMYARRIDEGQLPSIDALAQLAEIQRELDAQTAEVVHALRSQAGGSHSWQEIADALGLATKGAALRRYGAAETDARRRGAQPANLR